MRCPKCKGQKRIMYSGCMYKECPMCEGEGVVYTPEEAAVAVEKGVEVTVKDDPKPVAVKETKADVKNKPSSPKVHPSKRGTIKEKSKAKS